MTKEFILKSLLPYKENPALCGYEEEQCVYLTEDNKKCAIGQYMKPGPWQYMKGSVTLVFDYHKEINIMTDEWLEQNITEATAYAMQGYHDVMADTKKPSDYFIKKLEIETGFNLDELK